MILAPPLDPLLGGGGGGGGGGWGGGGGGSISELTVFIVTNSTAALGTTPVLRGGYSIFECKSRLNL